MSIRKDLSQLQQAGIINDETASRIDAWYQSNDQYSSNKLFIVFGILGAVLCGLGVILILTYNWDQLSRFSKTVVAFSPMFIGQILCAYTLWKRSDSTTWREATSTFLYLSIGACLALVSQIYNIPGKTASFLLVWTLLGLPIIYVMSSAMASLMYIGGITWYTCQTGYFDYPVLENWYYWLLLLGCIPFYIKLIRTVPQSNFTIYHHWLIPLSMTIVLGTIANDHEFIMFIAYMSMFGLFYLIGDLPRFESDKLLFNGFKCIGGLGLIVLLLVTSFNWFWKEVRDGEWMKENLLTSSEVVLSAIFTLAAISIFIISSRKKSLKETDPFSLVFILFIIIFIIGRFHPVSVLLINILLLSLGILTIRRGSKEVHLGILNLGLLIITALIVCRFFDSSLGLIVKGLLFVLVGIGFFMANYWLIRKKKEVYAK